MKEATKQALMTTVRLLVALIAAGFTAKGLLTEAAANTLVDTIMTTVSGLLTVGPLLYEIYDNYRAERKAKDREVTALNVGIAVSNADSTLTPPVPPAAAQAVLEQFAPAVKQAIEESKP